MAFEWRTELLNREKGAAQCNRAKTIVHGIPDFLL